jgi:acyl-CoA thioester hydrolase
MRLRYHQAVQMGTEAIVRTRVAPLSGVRLEWLYQIETRAERSGASQLCLTGQVTLVPIDRHQRKIVRRLPAELKLVFEQIAGYFAESS